MSDICVICRENLPKKEKRLRRSNRLKERVEEVEEEENLNIVNVSCCKQEFHATCLLQSLQVSSQCPLCRALFLPEQPQQIVHHYHAPQRVEEILPLWRRDPLGCVFILVGITFFLWTLYFISREWYNHGILYIIQMFIAVGMNVLGVGFAGLYFQRREERNT